MAVGSAYRRGQIGMNAMMAIRVAGVLGALAVALGAFGAHGLKGRVAQGLLDPALLEAFKTGVQYHFYHVLAILALGLAGESLWGSRWAGAAVIAWTLGVVLFSGSLYAMTFTGARWLGAITPLGGLAFIAGWVLLLLATRR